MDLDGIALDNLDLDLHLKERTQSLNRHYIHFFNSKNKQQAGTDYHQIECGYNHSAVIDGNRNAFIFGLNAYGQIGNGDPVQMKKVCGPFMVSIKNKKWQQLSLGRHHTLLLTDDNSGNEVYACGFNDKKRKLCFSFDTDDKCVTPVLCSRENMGIADNETHIYGKIVRVIAMRESSIIVVEQIY